ncbi:hypothetical protein A6A04_13265 [Paramagnetospirillum marisnigri]|uniref:Uncharacterized protein n=1 Tax=Paramagnetospirillum marisnigri TaxID=1285242 RepID=A0A178MWT7_9PROT|nr:hypothetical protein [Paramagnetospirillum marisnigri]OAN53856.1 hypothetical protein A6A04_13265 [Paramagnetospirillum marisnigri]
MGVISSAELHRVRSGHEWALIALDDHTGLVAIQSSYGAFNHIWPPQHRSQPLGEFIATLDFDYFMTKTRGTAAREFDFDGTVANIRGWIKRARRERGISKDVARDAISALDAIDHTTSSDYFATQICDDADLMQALGSEWYEAFRTRYTPECEWFWKTIWADFRWQLLCRDGLESPFIGL